MWAAGPTSDPATDYMTWIALGQVVTDVSPWTDTYNLYMPIYTTEWYHTTYGVISLYIPEEDLYFDIEMESWTSGGAGGGFSYTRTSTAGGAGNMMTYTPSENFNGTDSFTFSVSDGTLLDTATVSVTVTSVADLSLIHISEPTRPY